ncbi:DDT domain-containing protein [Dictyostelium discoideum AX4]|uniref:DDT domain-containing protein n=1 Tax=Dictyostelium discoideum TaxID=44689 RepID=Q55F76_DICDI|nr:DDT domain-containing protein [Dictyostelium discoideum AX4]EAL73565.1 DDT domain-containing protein [Dictyostelium discoideum AX4]|eukprot:XP_647657.1 DDT domain-containing protein [Dictyostelium discoideum AX4]
MKSADVSASTLIATPPGTPTTNPTTTTTTSTPTTPVLRGSVSTPKTKVEDETEIIRSMWETPAIYQYLTFFKQTLGVRVISTDDLESSLLNPKNNIKLLGDIFIPLLKELLPVTKARTLNHTTWELFLKQELNKENSFFNCFEENPFNEDSSLFSEVSLKNRILLLKSVCDWNLSKSPNILESVKQIIAADETDKLRNLPMGILNDQKEFYWYFGDHRLYKETLTMPAGSNGIKKRSKNNNNNGNIIDEKGKWEIICQTKEEWEELIKKYEPFHEEINKNGEVEEVKEESDEKTLCINLKDVLPQVLSKLSSIKRKRTMFTQVPIGSSPIDMNESKQWKSMRLLSQNLKKKEQEEFMEIQQHQQQQLEADPYNRPRSSRVRTNLFFNDSGVLNGGGGIGGGDGDNDDNDNDDEDDDDDGGDNIYNNGRASKSNRYNKSIEPTVHLSRSGRRIITAGLDQQGRPVSANQLSVDTKKKLINDFNDHENVNNNNNNGNGDGNDNLNSSINNEENKEEEEEEKPQNQNQDKIQNDEGEMEFVSIDSPKKEDNKINENDRSDVLPKTGIQNQIN